MWLRSTENNNLRNGVMPVAILDPNRLPDPIPNFGFVVEIGSEVAGWFTECSGLTIEREVKAHPEGGVNDYVHQLPGRIKRSNITLKHGLADNELWDWFQKGALDGYVERRNVSIILYNIDLTEVERWDLIDVYPAKWSGPSFNSGNSEVLVESLELTQMQSSNTVSPAAIQRVSSEEGGSAPTVQGIDTNALAQKVYDLLKNELRIERDRLGYR